MSPIIFRRLEVISYYAPKKDAAEEDINIDGRKYPYIKRSSNDFEWAVVMEAERSGNGYVQSRHAESPLAEGQRKAAYPSC